MSGARAQLVPVLLAGMLCLYALSPAQAAQRHSARRPAAQKQKPPAPPTAPLTLEQMPAMPPQVTYQNGLLTIRAQNSTLGDILRAVRAQTSAAVDVPPNATERVVGQIGPGPAREVLASLLNGSHFNYVMLGSASNPGALERVVLTPRQSAPAGGPPSATQPVTSMVQPVYTPPTLMQPPVMNQSAQEGQAEGTEEGEGSPESDESGAEQPEAPPQQPAVPQGIKTPEQLLQELQRQQQMQRQPQVVYPPNQPPTEPPR